MWIGNRPTSERIRRGLLALFPVVACAAKAA